MLLTAQNNVTNNKPPFHQQKNASLLTTNHFFINKSRIHYQQHKTSYAQHCGLTALNKEHKKAARLRRDLAALMKGGVVPPGIEPGTQGFSVLCSTN